jgi:ABC-type glycerol-3-phosphate transport system substrate-binding protein
MHEAGQRDSGGDAVVEPRAHGTRGRPQVSRRALFQQMAGGGAAAGAALAAACASGRQSPPSAAALAPATLEVWYGAVNGLAVKPMEQVIAPTFTARFPQIKLELAQKNGLADLLVAAAAGAPPALTYMGAATVVSAVQAGVALAIDDRMKQWGQKGDFLPAALDQATWKGQLWGMPVEAEPKTYFWRQDLLQQEGVRQLPTTFEESLDTIRRLTVVRDGAVVRHGFGLTQVMQEFFMGMRGLGLALARGGKSAFNGPDGLSMLQYQVDRALAATPAGATPVQTTLAQNPVGKGVWAGIWENFGESVRRAQLDTPDTARAIAVGQPLVPSGQRYRAPAGKTWKPTALSFHNWYLLAKETKYPDQGWEFQKHVAAPEMLMPWNEAIGRLPPRRSLQGKDWLAEPQAKALFDVYQRYSQAQYKYPVPNNLNPALNRPLTDAVAGKLAPKEALDQAARDWDAVMGRESFRDDVV